MASSDMEDVVAVLDGRLEAIDEIGHAAYQLRALLVRDFEAILKGDGLLEL